MADRLTLVAFSATKAKAIDDARKTQASILRECAQTGKEPPPYILSELIGKGSFGRVYKATNSARPGQLVAVKIISIEEGDALEPRGVDTICDVLKEANTLKVLSASGARNINTVIDTLLFGQSVWMVTEYCAGGSVSTLMRPTGCLPEKWIIPIVREVAEAIYWVHRQGIIHRDIKCSNVLVTETGSIQLCDFGVAGIIESKCARRSTITGSLQWMAPELFSRDVSYGTEVDIWAFGSMIYEVASGLPPNAAIAVEPSDFCSYLKQNCPRLEGDQYSPQLKDLVAFCLVDDPMQRPSIEQVQRHPYIFQTDHDYPTESLSMLLSAYKLWQSRGGNRLSLFCTTGAQGGCPQQNQPFHLPDWDFEEEQKWVPFDNAADAKAVYKAYGLPLDDPSSPIIASLECSPRMTLEEAEAPLERLFNPNTISNYRDNSRAFYSKQTVRPLADPPRWGTPPARGSLIDASLVNGDQDTIRFNQYSISPADRPSQHVQNWAFPSSGRTASVNMTDFEAVADLARRIQEWTFPQSDATYTGNLCQSHIKPDESPPFVIDHRGSTISLIDLDASTVDDELGLHPSPRHSGNSPGRFEGQGASFDFDFIRSARQPSIYVPGVVRLTREPSLYLSNEIGAYPTTDNEAG